MHKLALLLFTVALLFRCQETVISGKVIKVADGDTFTILADGNQQIRIRLHGIDAPEKNQDFSRVSMEHLTELIMHKEVRVYPKRKDPYRRIVGIVKVGETNVNEAMLKTGLAWHYTEYDKNPEWAEMERLARQQKIGIWSHKSPVPPWEFRQAKRKQPQDRR